MTEKEVMNYDGLLAGQVYEVDTVPLAEGQKVVRGDLLECVVTEGVPAATFAKATAEAKTVNLYRIAAENKDTTGGQADIVGYGAGYYNSQKVNVSGDAEKNRIALKGAGMILKQCQSGTM